MSNLANRLIVQSRTGRVLANAITLRDRLTHPTRIMGEEAGRAILAIIETIDTLYQAIYNKRFPVHAGFLRRLYQRPTRHSTRRRPPAAVHKAMPPENADLLIFN